MSHVRPFVEDDIPQVAHLHEKVIVPDARSPRSGPDPHRAYFSRVFLDNPSREAGIPSLVYEEDDGRVVGFLGVLPRRMSMNGERFYAALGSQFVIDPASRTAIVAVQLAKSFLEGPQDVSIADEATDVHRSIWEGLGGTTALLHSIYWTRPLRPAQLALSFLRNRASLVPLAMIADGPSRIVDALATRLPRSHLFQAPPRVFDDDLHCETFLARLPELGAASLRVEYDEGTFRWLLELAADRKRDGTLQKAVIRNDEAIVGWYLYHLDSTGVADVLQIAATPSSIHEVLDHLFYQAWRQGATAVTGRLEPRFLQAFSEKYCLLHRRGPWVLVDAKKPEVLRAFQSGDTFFSRFDGEWCLGF
jgi:hypothetical protein